MATRRQSSPPMLPYRDSDGILKYAPAPGAFDHTTSAYDSDYEPLMRSAMLFTEDEDEVDITQRFTSTGGPMPAFRPNAYSHFLNSAPVHVPVRYTDDSVIPVVVQLPDPVPGQ
jgi:hypothetical protein